MAGNDLITNSINPAIHNGELRILDTDLAARLGFDRPRDIRKLIKRYEADLGKMGTCATMARVIRGNETEVYYLNKKQSIFITAKAETAEATDITIEIIEKFDAYERGAEPQFKAPTNMIEALTQALEREKVILELEATNKELAPKAAGLELLAEKDGELGIRDTGRELKVGQGAVREEMFMRGWACRQGRDIRPASYGLKCGYVRLVQRIYTHPLTGQEKVSDDFRVTRKGIARLAEIFASKG